jgi:hypothetical protein
MIREDRGIASGGSNTVVHKPTITSRGSNSR